MRSGSTAVPYPLRRILRRITLESGLLLGGAFFLAGFAGCAWVTWQWAASGFGPLHEVRQVLFWSMWLFLGLQVIFGSFFLSMLGISRGTFIGDYEQNCTAATSQSSWPFTWISRWHHAFVFQRRTRVLAELLAARIPQHASVLDIGCGGTTASLIAQLRPDVSIQGVEYMVRPGCKIERHSFDGSALPFPGASFDVCLFVDVLHHTQDPAILLREATRVARSFRPAQGSSGRKQY